MNLRNYFPILQWLPTYDKKWRTADVIAGLTVGVMLVPQGMAYAMLAGMPPIYGLYGGLVPLFLYAIFGTSRQMSIGPVAVSALLVLAGISQVADPMTETYIQLVILTGLLIGIAQVCLSFLRMGFLVNFLSHPVIAGFTSAAAVIIAVSQLKYLFGIPVPRIESIPDTLYYLFSHINEINWLTFVMGVAGIVIILGLRKISRKIPGPLLVVVVGIFLVGGLGMDAQGVAVVGKVPEGLPSLILPAFNWSNIQLVLPTVFTVTLIGIVESIGIAKVIEAKQDYYKIDPNQELLALGISKMGGAFFQAIPTSGSFTRSAVNNETGAKTSLSSIVTATLIALTLILLTPLFYYLPTAVLASIVMVSVIGLFDYREAIHLWKTHRAEFYMMMTTFITTLALGIEEGVVAGILVSLGYMIYKNSRPHVAVLGQLPNSRSFRNVNRYPHAIQQEEILIMRFDAQLYFANANYFSEAIAELVKAKGPQLKVFILDCASIHHIDSSGITILNEVHEFLSRRNISFYLSGMIGPVRDILYKTGFMEKIGDKNQFMYIFHAVTYFNSHKNGEAQGWSPHALQHNAEKD